MRLGTGVNDATPVVRRDSTAIAHDQPTALSLSAMISQYFIGGMMSGELVLRNKGEHPVCFSRSTVYGTSCVAATKVDEQDSRTARR
jgi:hypothetical protein